jgi:E3 Ubiquitin ligase
MSSQPDTVALSHHTQAEIVAAVCGALAVLALWAFFVRFRRDRVVADTPLTRIRSAAQGYVKISGRAAPASEAPTAAPLSSRPCVWWSYEIAVRETDSKGNKSWKTQERASSTELFVLIDEDSRCLIGPVQAEVTPTVNDTWYGTQMRPDTPPIPGGSMFQIVTGDYRYKEQLLKPGDRLCVLGDLRSHSEGATTDLGAAVAAKLREWKQDPRALLARFDTNHDGKIDASEWEAARAAAARETQSESLQKHIERISVVSKPANGEPFLIAPMSADSLERRERLMAAVYFAAALIALAACIVALKHN